MAYPSAKEGKVTSFGLKEQELRQKKDKDIMNREKDLKIEFIKIPIVNPWARSIS